MTVLISTQVDGKDIPLMEITEGEKKYLVPEDDLKKYNQLMLDRIARADEEVKI